MVVVGPQWKFCLLFYLLSGPTFSTYVHIYGKLMVQDDAKLHVFFN